MVQHLFWFRQDLRLGDNPGFFHACEAGKVLPIYIHDPALAGEHALGEASQVWLHHSLEQLNRSLNGALSCYTGSADEIIPQLIKDHAITGVYWNRCYEPWRREQDERLQAQLNDTGIPCHTYKASLLWEPWEVLKQDGTPYKVFTPFYKRGCLSQPRCEEPLPVPPQMDLKADHTRGGDVASLNLLPKQDWWVAMMEHWSVGEKGALSQLEWFLGDGINGYKEKRNIPAAPHVSRLSPHLHMGEVSPLTLLHELQQMPQTEDTDHFLSEIGWREFSYYLLWHFPTLVSDNLQSQFDQFPWDKTTPLLDAWKKGQTGYPIVDAGMRELWQTGYMHNRVRMIVGSFLVKNLGIHWHQGEAWFRHCLVDADSANNSASWQWIAGCGADAAPYFRVFNPILQSKKFDPDGHYIRQYVPELKHLSTPHLFAPWEAPEMPQGYPMPIVDIKESREQALDNYARMKASL